MTLEEIKKSPLSKPTILRANIEADVLNALITEFEETDRVQDDLIEYFYEKLLSSRINNWFVKSDYYQETCKKFIVWASENRQKISKRWPLIMEIAICYNGES